MHSRFTHISNKENSKPSSHVNYRYLTSPVKNERLSLLHRQVRISDRRLQWLRDKLEAATRVQGVQVDEELHHEMQDIMKSNANSISHLQPGSFPSIFWQQQLQAASQKDHRGMRWHPLMIKWCLYLRHCSSSCYETLRQSHVLTLPSQRTLRDYTYAVETSIGYSCEGDKQLFEAAHVATCDEFKRNVLITMDEMYIKEDLVFKKHTGELIGFTNLGDINMHLHRFEQRIKSQSSDFQSIDDIAKSMLVVMVRGLFSNLNYPYAQFPCADPTGDALFDPFWEAVMRLER